MRMNPDILIVIAVAVIVFALSRSVAAWVDGRVSIKALVSLAIGLGLLGWVHVALRDGGLSLRAIPDAFIHVAAMVLG